MWLIKLGKLQQPKSVDKKKKVIIKENKYILRSGEEKRVKAEHCQGSTSFFHWKKPANRSSLSLPDIWFRRSLLTEVVAFLYLERRTDTTWHRVTHSTRNSQTQRLSASANWNMPSCCCEVQVCLWVYPWLYILLGCCSTPMLSIVRDVHCVTWGNHRGCITI